MDALKPLSDLSNQELFALVKDCASNPDINSKTFLLTCAAELRKRALWATEDYVLQMAADIPDKPLDA